jgi:acyl-CoA dehydrogenase
VAVDQKVRAEARSVGREVAARWADRVDAEARFPAETVAALRASGLLGALVPLEWGGPGASMQEMVEAVVILAEHCGSSGLVLAMHQIQVASVVRHGSASACELVLPRIVAGELLLANANSEVGLGGNRRSSICALEPSSGGFRLEKQASTVSYGEDADGVLATARRTPESPPDDQVLAVCLPPDLHVEPRGDWNTLGLRGTCSKPCQLTAEIPPELVIADYADVFTRTALPLSSVLLSAVWLGIAEGAARRAHATVRAQARKLRKAASTGAPPPSALRLAELGVVLHQMREVLTGGTAAYERAKDTREVQTLRFSGWMDNVKLSTSTLVIDVVQRAMAICGLPGYQNDSNSSIARLMRDAAAAPLMVNNDRALLAAAQTLLVRKDL